MNVPYKFSLNIKLLKKLVFLFLLIHLSGCKVYLQWWDEEMFLYRPSVVESAAMRSEIKKKTVLVPVNETVKLNYGLTLESVQSENPAIATVCIDEIFTPKKTIKITGEKIGKTIINAHLADGRIIKIATLVTN